jgi:hypothetical protein
MHVDRLRMASQRARLGGQKSPAVVGPYNGEAKAIRG